VINFIWFPPCTSWTIDSVLLITTAYTYRGVTKHCSSHSNYSGTLDWVGGLEAICINSVLQPQKCVIWFNHPLLANHTGLVHFVWVISIIKETTPAVSLLQLIQQVLCWELGDDTQIIRDHRTSSCDTIWTCLQYWFRHQSSLSDHSSV